MTHAKLAFHYMNFRVLRLDPAYHRLLPNEKVVAKQEFLSAFESAAERMPVAAYAGSGLSAACDVLIWRVSPHLKDLHAMTARLQSAGMGKFLSPARSWLGTVSADRYAWPLRGGRSPGQPPIGNAPNVVVRAARRVGSGAWPEEARFAGARVHLADGRGLGDVDWVTAFETADPLQHREFAAAAPSCAESETVVGILAPIRDIVDSLG